MTENTRQALNLAPERSEWTYAEITMTQAQLRATAAALIESDTGGHTQEAAITVLCALGFSETAAEIILTEDR